MEKFSLNTIISVMRQKGYVIYVRPYELNIVGIRGKSTTPNQFDDQICIFYRNNNHQWVYQSYPATTDPGTFWLRNPSEPQGTAMLMHGQYINAYQIGLHRGQYIALVQAKPVNYWRDYNRDSTLDFNNGKKYSGLIGLNIHRANKNGTTKTVDRNSAACQVFANAEDFEVTMNLADKHSKLYGNSFTYTLIDFRAASRQRRKKVAGAVAAVAAAALAYKIISSASADDELPFT